MDGLAQIRTRLFWPGDRYAAVSNRGWPGLAVEEVVALRGGGGLLVRDCIFALK